MRPLLKKDITNFLDRFDNFVGAELRSIKIDSQTDITLTVVTQDKARDFDWISLELNFNEIIDAKLLDDGKLQFLNMEDGLSIFNEDEKFVFSTGITNNIQNAKNSSLYIISKNLKYKEGIFN